MLVQDLNISGKVHFRGQKVGISVRDLSKENIDVLQIGERSMIKGRWRVVRDLCDCRKKLTLKSDPSFKVPLAIHSSSFMLTL